MEDGKQDEAAAVYDATERLHVRVRHAVFASYADPDDPRIGALGKLGVGPNQQDNAERLAAVAGTPKDPAERGGVALVPDLAPTALATHAALHVQLNKEKGGATAGRQSKGKVLSGARQSRARILQRVKNFVKSFYGPEALEAFGFGLPVPARRPRLRGVANDPGPTEPTAE